MKNGLSVPTAIEIFKNPHDLDISISQSECRYGFLISRGPEGNFQLLRKSLNFAESAEEAIGVVEQLLGHISKYETSFLPDYNDFLYAILASETNPPEYGPVLTSTLVERIVEDLHRECVARTYEVRRQRAVRPLECPPPSSQYRRGGKKKYGGKQHRGKNPYRFGI